MNTPKSKKKQVENVQDKSSGKKKMVQARLPFKIIASSPSSPTAHSEIDKEKSGLRDSCKTSPSTLEIRKRKLSMGSDEDENEKSEEIVKENLNLISNNKKKKMECESMALINEVVVLDDDDEVNNEDLVINDAKSEMPIEKPKEEHVMTKKLMPKGNDTGKRPKDDSKLQIKLPMPNKKKRKSKGLASSDISVVANIVLNSSDDDDHPKKRSKTEIADSSQPTNSSTENTIAKNVKEINSKWNSDKSQTGKDNTVQWLTAIPKSLIEPSLLKERNDDAKCTSMLNDSEELKRSSEKGSQNVEQVSIEVDATSSLSDCSEVFLGTEDTDNLRSDTSFNKNKPGEGAMQKFDARKPLTAKQQKLLEQRRQAREEKERKLQEERERKQKEKEEQKQQKIKEREEKEQQKKKERDEKTQKRQAEIDAKNEEKRKRNEAREEELRKKEEERKRKEQEKEEAEMKKKKAAQAFTKFFVPKSTVIGNGSQTSVEHIHAKKQLAFRPFQVKGDMQMAPVLRKQFTSSAKQRLDNFLKQSQYESNASALTNLYLSELRSGKVVPIKFRQPSVSDSDDVQIIDDLERAGEAIVEETPVPVERFRAKFYKFHENGRPPYYGTWRKKTDVITPRRPFAQDEKFFDYEVDSDLEWEEEEPGESLDGSDDDKEKESEDDDYEVDNVWFVPHGHLSEEELQDEDECGMDENTREAQKAKLKLLQQEFAEEMKKKTEKIKPRLIGCIWVDENGNIPELCPKIIWDTLNKRAMMFACPPLVEEPEVPEKEEQSANISQELTEPLLKDLVKLVHGNRHSKAFMIKEFLAYVAEKDSETKLQLKSAAVREKIDEFAEWKSFVMRKKNKKKKNKKFLCWVVSSEVLKRLELENISLHNKWSYRLQPKYGSAENDHPVNELENDVEEKAMDEGNGTSPDKDKGGEDVPKRISIIKKFTKVLTPEEKAAQLLKFSQKPKPSQSTTAPTDGDGTTKSLEAESKSAPPVSAPAIKKRVSLLMSVPRGQQINQAAKNVLISQFLNANSNGAASKADASAKTDDTAKEKTSEDIIKPVQDGSIMLM